MLRNGQNIAGRDKVKFAGGTYYNPDGGIDHALEELDFIAESGLPSVAFYNFPNGTPYAEEEDNRFWEKSLELGLKLAPHFGFGAREAPLQSAATGTANSPWASALVQRAGNHAPVYCMDQLIAAGVLDRFPEIKFYFAETNASWLPGTLFFLDDNYDLFRDWFKVTYDRRPSEQVVGHFHFSVIRDPVVFDMDDIIPWDNIMWGTDFPHSVGSFPDSQEYIAEHFPKVDEPIARKVLLENPAKETFAHTLHRAVHPAQGDLLDRLNRVNLAGVHEVGGAELAGKGLFGRVVVHRDDLGGHRDPGGLDHVEADAPHADHRHAVAPVHLGPVEDRSGAGEHSAADEAGAGERNPLVDGHHLALAHHHLLGEHAGVGETRNPLSLIGEVSGQVAGAGLLAGLVAPGDRRPQLGVLAQGGVAGGTHRAASAVVDGGDDHVVAHRHRGDFAAYLQHLASPLVAHDERWREHRPERPVDHRHVGVAHPGGPDPNPHLVGLKIGHTESLGDHCGYSVEKDASHCCRS